MAIRVDVSAQLKAVKEQQAQVANSEIPTSVIINGTSLKNDNVTWAGIKQALRDYGRCRADLTHRDVVEYVKRRFSGKFAVILVSMGRAGCNNLSLLPRGGYFK